MPDRIDTAVVPVARFTIPDGTPLCHLCYGCGHFAGGTCWECLGTGYDGKVVRALRDAAKRKAGLTDA